MDNQTTGNKKGLYDDVIDCTEMALSQAPAGFEVESNVGLEELFLIIEQHAHAHNLGCVGPFQAAELIAAKLGTKYVRASRRLIGSTGIVSLEDLI